MLYIFIAVIVGGWFAHHLTQRRVDLAWMWGVAAAVAAPIGAGLGGLLASSLIVSFGGDPTGLSADVAAFAVGGAGIVGAVIGMFQLVDLFNDHGMAMAAAATLGPEMFEDYEDLFETVTIDIV